MMRLRGNEAIKDLEYNIRDVVKMAENLSLLSLS